MISAFHFLIELLLFIAAVFVLFYFPGKFILSKLKIKLVFHEDIFFCTVSGLMLFTLLSYIFSWLKIPILALLIVLIFDFIIIKKTFFPRFEKKHFYSFFIILVLSIIFSLSMVLAGQYGDKISLRLDDLWHLALINELKVNFPPGNPGFAEVPLKGYHFFYNFLLAQISNIFHLSPLLLHFHFFPFFLSFLWASGVYALMFSWTKSKIASLWAIFLTMFGGSFVFILKLQGHDNISLDSGFGMSQPMFSLWNPPFSISIIILLGALFSMLQYTTNKKKGWLVSLVLAVGIISMFKVYAGIILIPAFLLLVLREFLKKNFLILAALFFAVLLFFFTYWIFADKKAHLIWFPVWAPHKVLLDNLPWYGYEEKQYTFSRLGVTRGIIGTELYSLYVFFIGNLGTRIIGLLILPLLFLKKRKIPSFFASMVLLMALISILIPLFFIQTGKVFEIIQMAWYFLFFCSLFASLGLARLVTFKYNKVLKIILVITIIALTLPSAYGDYTGYFKSLKSREDFSSAYYMSMNFLSSQGVYNDTVIEIPPKETFVDEINLTKWYNFSTPKIAAFGNKRSYIDNEYIDFPGVEIKPRIKLLNKILLFRQASQLGSGYDNMQKDIEKSLLKNNIVYVYSPYPIDNFLSIENMHQIFQNEAATIYKFGRN